MNGQTSRRERPDAVSARRDAYAFRPVPRAIGELVESPDYAFAFREMEPVPAPARRLVVALHGADGDEMQFANFAALLDGGDANILPRGPRTIGGGRIGWFREAVGDGQDRVEPEEFDDSLEKMLAFVDQLQRRHDVAPADTVLMGFSQGGELALSAAVTAPACCGAVAMIAGRLPRRVEERIAPPHDLGRLDVLLLHAPDDEVLPIAHAHEAAAFLTAQGLRPELRQSGGGHRFSPAFGRELLRWLNARAGAATARA